MGRVIEPRKPRSRRSQRVRSPRMAMATCPNNSDLDASLLTGSESSANLHKPGGRESGDLAGASPRKSSGRQSREGDKPRAVIHACEKSRALVVPGKPSNSG